jgi:hypothetical protein
MPLAAALIYVVSSCAFLAACGSDGGAGVTFLADPGKYEFYSCEQLTIDMKALIKRRQDLKSLMDRAEQTTTGAAVGLMAYRTDYINAGEEQKLLDAAARGKSCPMPENWLSSTVVR